MAGYLPFDELDLTTLYSKAWSFIMYDLLFVKTIWVASTELCLNDVTNNFLFTIFFGFCVYLSAIKWDIKFRYMESENAINGLSWIGFL